MHRAAAVNVSPSPKDSPLQEGELNLEELSVQTTKESTNFPNTNRSSFKILSYLPKQISNTTDRRMRGARHRGVSANDTTRTNYDERIKRKKITSLLKQQTVINENLKEENECLEEQQKALLSLLQGKDVMLLKYKGFSIQNAGQKIRGLSILECLFTRQRQRGLYSIVLYGERMFGVKVKKAILQQRKDFKHTQGILAYQMLGLSLSNLSNLCHRITLRKKHSCFLELCLFSEESKMGEIEHHRMEYESLAFTRFLVHKLEIIRVKRVGEGFNKLRAMYIYNLRNIFSGQMEKASHIIIQMQSKMSILGIMGLVRRKQLTDLGISFTRIQRVGLEIEIAREDTEAPNLLTEGSGVFGSPVPQDIQQICESEFTLAPIDEENQKSEEKLKSSVPMLPPIHKISPTIPIKSKILILWGSLQTVERKTLHRSFTHLLRYLLYQNSVRSQSTIKQITHRAKLFLNFQELSKIKNYAIRNQIRGYFRVWKERVSGIVGEEEREWEKKQERGARAICRLVVNRRAGRWQVGHTYQHWRLVTEVHRQHDISSTSKAFSVVSNSMPNLIGILRGLLHGRKSRALHRLETYALLGRERESAAHVLHRDRESRDREMESRGSGNTSSTAFSKKKAGLQMICRVLKERMRVLKSKGLSQMQFQQFSGEYKKFYEQMYNTYMSELETMSQKLLDTEGELGSVQGQCKRKTDMLRELEVKYHRLLDEGKLKETLKYNELYESIDSLGLEKRQLEVREEELQHQSKDLKNAIGELENRVYYLEGEIRVLGGRNVEISGVNNRLETDVNIIRSENMDLKANICSKEEQILKLSKNKNEYQEIILSKEGRIAKLQSELTKVQGASINFRENEENLATEINIYQDNIANLEGQIDEQRREMSLTREEKIFMEEQLSSLKLDHSKVQMKLESALEDVAEANAEVELKCSIIQKYEGWEKNAENMAKTIDSLAYDKELLVEQIESAANDIKTLRDNYYKQVETNTMIKSQLMAVQEGSRHSNRTIEEMHLIIQRIELEKETLLSENEELQKEINQRSIRGRSQKVGVRGSQNNLKLKSTSIGPGGIKGGLGRKSTELFAAISPRGGANTHTEAAMQNYEQRIKHLKEVNSKLQKSILEKNDHIDRLKSQNTEITRELVTITKDSTKVKEEIKDNISKFGKNIKEKKKLGDKVVLLEQEMSIYKNENIDLANKMQGFSMKNDENMRKQEINLERERESYRISMESKIRENDRLKGMISRLEGEMNSLQDRRDRTADYSRIKKENEKLQKSMDNYNIESHSLRQQIKKLEQHTETSENNIEKLESKLAAKTQELEIYRKNGSQAKSEVQKAFREMENYAKILATLENKVRILQKEKESAVKESTTAKIELDAVRERYAKILGVQKLPITST